MDPLTHTLAGANLGATKLRHTTRFAAAAAVIGANLPDVDAILYFTGQQDLAFGFRRGWTHGVLALVLLPFLQTAAFLLADRLRPNAMQRVNARMLLLISTIAIWSHPSLDWLNTYGMRWLMPFRGTWFYGDSVFIMDPWLWLILGAGWLVNRRPTPALIASWLFFTAAILWVVSSRSTAYLPVVAIVAIVLLIALLVRTRRELATIALIVAALYIGARLGIHAFTVREVQRALPEARRMMVGPDPIDPRKWNVIAATSSEYVFGEYRWGRGFTRFPETRPLPVDTPEYRAARAHPSVSGFANWSRFPSYTIERVNGEKRVTLSDARRTGGSSRVVTVK